MEKLFQMRKNICRKVFLVLVAILLCGCGRNMEDEIPSVQQPDINITEELPTNAPEITLPTNAPEISLPAQEIEQIVQKQKPRRTNKIPGIAIHYHFYSFF